MADEQLSAKANPEKNENSESPTVNLFEYLWRRIQEIKNKRQQGQQDAVLESEIQRQLTQELQEHLRKNLQEAKDLTEVLNKHKDDINQIPSEYAREKDTIKQVVELFAEAGKQRLIAPPTNEVSQLFYESLADTLYEHGVSHRTAILFEPLIHGVINRQDYLKFSREGEELTPFEQDLKNLLSRADVGSAVQDVLVSVLEKKQISNISPEQLQAKLDRLKSNSQEQTRHTELTHTEMNRKYKTYLNRLRDISKSEKSSSDKGRTDINNERKKLQKSPNLSDSERESRLAELHSQEIELNNEDQNRYAVSDAILTYLESNEVSPPFNSEEEIIAHLQRNFSTGEINEMRGIFPVMSEMQGRTLGQNTGYEDLGRKIMKDYSKEEIKSEVIDISSGKPVINIDKLNEVQSKLEDDLGILFDTLYNSPKSNFQEAFSPYSEGQMLRNVVQRLRTVFSEISSDFAAQRAELVGKPGTTEYEDEKRRVKADADSIFRDKIIAVIQRRPAIEQVVHQYQQSGATIDLENLLNIYKTYDITTLQEFYNDELTLIMSDLMPQFIQKKLIENDNNVITDLFQLVQDESVVEEDIVRQEGSNGDYKYERQVIKYKDECINYMEKILNDMYQKRQLKRPVSRDQINARFSRAYLDNFLLTLRGVKVLARAKPMIGAADDLPFGNLVTRIFNPLHDWPKFGLRGRGGTRSGDAETVEFQAMQNFQFNEDAFFEWQQRFGHIYKDFHPAQIMKEGQSKILYQLYPDNDTLMADLRSGKWDVFQSMLEVYGGLGIGNIIDQGGWPFSAFMDEKMPQLAKELTGKDWSDMSQDEKYDAVYRTAGVIPAFWFAGGDSGGQTESRFLRFLARDKIRDEEKKKGAPLSIADQNEIAKKHKLTIGSEEFDKLLDKYTVSSDRFQKIYQVKVGNKTKGMTHREFGLNRELAAKGKVFHQLLLKDPLAWLGEMTQMLPELSEGFVSYTDKNSNTHHVLASEFYFNLDQYPDASLSKTDKEKRDRFRFNALTKFRGSEEDNFMTNVPYLQKIMNFYANVDMSYSGRDIDAKKMNDEDKAAVDRGKSIGRDQLYSTLSTAHRIAVKNQQSRINKEDTIIKDKDSQDNRIHDLMFGDQGLVTSFEEMVGDPDEYFGNGEESLGEENGFYQRWAYTFKQTNSTRLPEGDTNMDVITSNIKNKQMLARRLESNQAYEKAQLVMAKLPSVCKAAGDASSFDEWYGKIEEIHSEMADLAGEDAAMEQKYQMELYFAICNYFSLDSDVEKMFVGFINDIKLGKDKAMVSIKADYANKFMLDADARRLYLRKLRDKTYLKTGFDMLAGAGFNTVELAAGVSWKDVIGKQIVYTMIAGTAFIIAYAAKKGLEDEMEDK